MARRVELEVAIKNPEAAESFFERLNRQIQNFKKQGKEELKNFSQFGAEFTAALGIQVAELTSSLTQGMTTSFSQAIGSAEKNRAVMTNLALSTGQSFEKVEESIRKSADRIGATKEAVVSFSRSVQATTGYWLEGTDALAAYQDRAKFLGKTIEEMSGEASQMSSLFDLRDGDKITAFFNTMNTQAEKLGVNSKVLSLQFDQMAGSLSHLTSASPEKLSALSAVFLKAAGGNKERAIEAEKGFLHYIEPRIPYIEDEMRAKGVLKKGESLRGEDGRIRGDLFLPMVGYEQDYIHSALKKDRKSERQRILSQGNTFGSPIAGELFWNADFSSLNPSTQAKAEAYRKLLDQYLQSDLAKSIQGENHKQFADEDLGKFFLPGKDKMTELGGGKTGVAVGGALTVGGIVMTRAIAKPLLKSILGLGEKVAENTVPKVAAGMAQVGGQTAMSMAAPAEQLALHFVNPGEQTAWWSMLEKPLARSAVAAAEVGAGTATRAGLSSLFLRGGAGALRFLGGTGGLALQALFMEPDNARFQKFTTQDQINRQLNYERARHAFNVLQERKDPHWYNFNLHGSDAPETFKSYLAGEEGRTFRLNPEDLKQLVEDFGEELVKATLKVQVVTGPPEPPTPPPPGEKNHV